MDTFRISALQNVIRHVPKVIALHDSMKTDERADRSLFCVIDDGLPIDIQERFRQQFKKIYRHVEFFSFVGAESGKTFDRVEEIISLLVASFVGSQWEIMGIGGGALLDTVGFVASIYLRGSLCPFISIPTTLLAMTDAAIGGKNGVNVMGIKNCVGTIFDPKEIYIIPELLKSIPKQDLIISSLEIWKHALLDSTSFVESYLTAIEDFITDSREDRLEEIILKSIEIKNRYVVLAKSVPSIRSLLNIGHTVGHAIEAAFSGQISHGASLFYGLHIERLVAEYRGEKISKEMIYYEEKLFQLILPFLPSKKSLQPFSREKYIDAILRDKKNKNKNSPCIIVLNTIGPISQRDEIVELFLSMADVEWTIDRFMAVCV